MTKTTDLKVPGVALNAGSLPLSLDDPMQITGALVVFEPGHPKAAFQMAGVPNVGPANVGTSTLTYTELPNVVAAKAAALTGASEAAVRPRYVDNTVSAQATATPLQNVKYERTPKGGLHVATAQAGQAAFLGSAVILSDALKLYLYNNPSHELYFSRWFHTTRPALDQGALEMPYLSLQKGSGVGAGWFNVGKDGPQGIAVANQSVPVGTRNVNGAILEQLSNNYDATALTNATTDFVAGLMAFSGIAGQYGDIARNKAHSGIIYRLNLIDLTAAGLTFAQMKAIDDAAYAKAFAPGGRYYGDTFTPIATLWPGA